MMVRCQSNSSLTNLPTEVDALLHADDSGSAAGRYHLCNSRRAITVTLRLTAAPQRQKPTLGSDRHAGRQHVATSAFQTADWMAETCHSQACMQPLTWMGACCPSPLRLVPQVSTALTTSVATHHRTLHNGHGGHHACIKAA
jgi:hypothetical protein